MTLFKRAAFGLLASVCLLAPAAADAQTIRVFGTDVPIQALGFGSVGGAVTAVTSADPLPMICISGCSATGAGTATAAAPTRIEGQSYGLSYDLTGALRVTGGGGGGGAGTEFAEDAAHSSGALGSLVLGVRKDTAASLAGADGDYTGFVFDASGRLYTNPSGVTQPVSGTFWQATQPVSAAALPLPSGAATSAAQTTAQTSLSSIDTKLSSQATAALQTTLNAHVDGLEALLSTQAGYLDGLEGQLTTLDGRVDGLEAALVTANAHLDAIETAAEDTTTPVLTTATACTPVGYQSAVSTNATNVKASAGTLCGGLVINTTGTIYYLRLYNLASAPTASSATGFVTTIPIPASTTGAGTMINLGPYGAAFSAGIGFVITAGGASTDNTNAATGVFVSLTYR